MTLRRALTHVKGIAPDVAMHHTLCKLPRFKRWLDSPSISPLFGFAHLLVRLDHVARFVVNANHGIM
jgi:hypothetical protein